MLPEWWEEACAALVARDERLAALIARARPPAVTGREPQRQQEQTKARKIERDSSLGLSL